MPLSQHSFVILASLGLTFCAPDVKAAEPGDSQTTDASSGYAPEPHPPTTQVPVSPGQTAPAPTPPLSETLTGEAKREYEAARRVFLLGDHEGAATKFKRSYQLSGDPRLLWNIAVCEKELRNYTRAIFLVNRYLEEGGTSLPKSEREQAEQTLISLRAYSSPLVFSALPEGARVFVDGEHVGTAPLEEQLFVDLGKRELEVRLEGHVPFRRVLEVPGSATVTLEVELPLDTSSARLVVLTNHPRSVITVDGVVRGSERWQGGLAPGPHELRVTAPGRNPYQAQLQLAPESDRTLEISLDRKKMPVWPWVAGGAVLVAGATVGGILLFSDPGTKVTGPEGDLQTIKLRF